MLVTRAVSPNLKDTCHRFVRQIGTEKLASLQGFGLQPSRLVGSNSPIPFCRPSINWIRFLVPALWLRTRCRRKGSVGEISLRNIVLEAGVAIGSQVFVEKVQQDLNFRRQP